MAATVQLDDVQGLVVRGYSGLKSACFLLLTIADPTAARLALGRLAPRVTNGRRAPRETAVHLALTSDGLRRLNLETPDIEGFSGEFVTGMTDTDRSRFLGDLGEEAPGRWRWGGPGTPPVHVLLLLYALDGPALERLEDDVRRDALADGGLAETARLDTADLGDHEPFGFRDGISQPLVEGLPKARAARALQGARAAGRQDGAGADVVRAGEFVLGYPNEYGLLTDRPLLPASYDPEHLLPRGPDGTADLGRNGTYLVLRQLRQDVEGFWSYLEDVTRRQDGSGDLAARDALAARLVGRWPSGAPLVHAPLKDDPALATDNDFGYFATDPDGLRCPLGAHIRRAHPRDSLDPQPGSARSVAIDRRHRILRRGRAYGPGSAAGDGGGERGLHFLCLNANISRQFEFIQHTWLNNPSFNGLHDGPDPLVAPHRDSRATFTVQARPLRTRYRDLPQFVSVRGGAYFFLPGLRALRYLCSTGRTTAAAPAGGRR
ncbi:peroxidase [Streptomyces sp. NPDC046197]|uniref:Dyp-type peroxidase n=1 Tax=Streptomyces sp. NPDC046197 TaxID=3154337 RepID=UPI0033E38297